jgi:hypothetical protein
MALIIDSTWRNTPDKCQLFIIGTHLRLLTVIIDWQSAHSLQRAKCPLDTSGRHSHICQALGLSGASCNNSPLKVPSASAVAPRRRGGVLQPWPPRCRSIHPSVNSSFSLLSFYQCKSLMHA